MVGVAMMPLKEEMKVLKESSVNQDLTGTALNLQKMALSLGWTLKIL